MSEYYVELRSKFPWCHYKSASVVSSRYYSVPTSLANDDNHLHQKQRTMLLLLFSLIRTKSNILLSYWVLVEPFGHFLKGNQQPSRNGIGGACNITLPTCLEKKHEVCDKCIPSFNQFPQEEPSIAVAYNNHNMIMLSKCQTVITLTYC